MMAEHESTAFTRVATSHLTPNADANIGCPSALAKRLECVRLQRRFSTHMANEAPERTTPSMPALASESGRGGSRVEPF
jgi:hypothetical protein